MKKLGIGKKNEQDPAKLGEPGRRRIRP